VTPTAGEELAALSNLEVYNSFENGETWMMAFWSIEKDINPSTITPIFQRANMPDSIKLSISTGNQFFFEQFTKKIKNY
jgi:hypothetical protein